MCMSLHGGHESYVASEIEKVNFKFYLIFIKFNLKKPHVATLLHGLTAPPPFSPSLLIWPLGPPLGGHTVTWVGSSLCQAHTHTGTRMHTQLHLPFALTLSRKPCLSSMGHPEATGVTLCGHLS